MKGFQSPALRDIPLSPFIGQGLPFEYPSLDRVLPRTRDLEWLARITSMAKERRGQGIVEAVEEKDLRRARRYHNVAKAPGPRATETVIKHHQRGDHVHVDGGTWRYSGCVRDQGYSCGPQFVDGPLGAGHAHRSARDHSLGSSWPEQYGNQQGHYQLADGLYQWHGHEGALV